MMKEFVYAQATGRLWLRDEGSQEKATPLGRGYAGHPPHVNATDAEALVARGPVPRGGYKLVGPFNHVRLGPVVFYMEPDKGNQMFGRSGFFVHGDNQFGNQTASHGCIILSRAVRERMQTEGVRRLVVV